MQSLYYKISKKIVILQFQTTSSSSPTDTSTACHSEKTCHQKNENKLDNNDITYFQP